MYILCVCVQYRLSTKEEQPPYPEWAQFIAAVIVLFSVLMIPTVLIVRLIAFQSARDEGKEFITRQIQCVKELFLKAIKYRYLWSSQY